MDIKYMLLKCFFLKVFNLRTPICIIAPSIHVSVPMLPFLSRCSQKFLSRCSHDLTDVLIDYLSLH